jgi:hypothetical protein
MAPLCVSTSTPLPAEADDGAADDGAADEAGELAEADVCGALALLACVELPQAATTTAAAPIPPTSQARLTSERLPGAIMLFSSLRQIRDRVVAIRVFVEGHGRSRPAVQSTVGRRARFGGRRSEDG